MADSIFTKIIKGEIPSHKIYEDDTTLAFLDIHPVVEGHTLVIPKKEVDKFYDLDDDTYAAVMRTVKNVAKHLEKTLRKRVGVLIVGVDVPHAHVQLIPFEHANEMYAQADMNAEPDHEALAKLAEKLRIET